MVVFSKEAILIDCFRLTHVAGVVGNEWYKIKNVFKNFFLKTVNKLFHLQLYKIIILGHQFP